MTRDDIVQLLQLVVAGDRRTIGPEDVAYWHAMLAPIPLARAIEALVLIQRREPDKWIRPGHIWQLCSTKTDGEHTGMPDLPDCDHGNFCATCKLVHHVDEPCTVLEARALPPVTVVVRALPAGPSVDVESPEVDPERARQMEAERARQLAALTALTEPETAQP
jgi:hypothetical protein